MNINLKNNLKDIRPSQLIFPLIVFVIFVGTVLGIVHYQNERKVKTPPSVEIETPADGARVDLSGVVLSGKVKQASELAVNGKEVVFEKDGRFSTKVDLNYGLNEVFISAKNKADQRTDKKITIERIGAPIADVQVPATTYPEEPAVKGDNLSNSGPENFWILESLIFAAAITAFIASRKKFADTLK